MTTSVSKWSLSRRLVALTFGTLIVLLIVSGIALAYLFEQHVERRVERELNGHLDRLLSVAKIANTGKARVANGAMANRFRKPYGGLYWQIEGDQGQFATSPSLWDSRLKLPAPSSTTTFASEYSVKGPGNQDLLVVSRRVLRNVLGNDRIYRFSVGLDHSEVSAAVNQFSRELVYGLLGVTVLLGALGWLQVKVGLKPLQRLVPEIDDISSGRTKRLTSDYPLEIAPLVQHLNNLLEQQEAVMERSRARAASLAHGLKTPMAAIAVEVQKLRQVAHADTVQNLDAQINSMSRQLERELIRSKIRSTTFGIRTRNSLKTLTQDVIETVQRLPRGDHLVWSVDLPDDLIVAMDTDDLAEIMGNILDNSRKWAQTEVHVSAVSQNGTVEIRIADDGNALTAEELSNLNDRGVRLDEASEGTGLGLAIVEDIVIAYGGELSTRMADLGGLEIRLVLPTGGIVDCDAGNSK